MFSFKEGRVHFADSFEQAHRRAEPEMLVRLNGLFAMLAVNHQGSALFIS